MSTLYSIFFSFFCYSMLFSDQVYGIKYSKLIDLKRSTVEGQQKYPYVVVDALTGVIIMSFNEHVKTFPSSMTKVMSLYILFSRLEDGSVKFEDMFFISQKAASKQGSKMFLKSGDKVFIPDLIKGIAICSGNDATIVLAEGLYGTEEAFAAEMNDVAKKLGMENSNFKNASGWPEDSHYTTAYDLALLALNLVKSFPKHYSVFSEKFFEYNNIKQYNYNKLINYGIGVDGIKTGHTDSGGYGIIASAKNHIGRRVILVINGCETESIRNREVRQLVKMGLQNFDNYLVLKENTPIVGVKVWLGSSDYVDAVSHENVIITLERKNLKNIKIKVVYTEPLKAPLKKGDFVGKLVITKPDTSGVLPSKGDESEQDNKTLEFPLYAAEDVKDVSSLTKFKRMIEFLIFGDQ